MKLHGFIGTFNSLTAMLVMGVLLSAGACVGSQIVDNVRADKLVRESRLVDMALLMYSRAHTNVLPDSVFIRTNTNGDASLDYQKGPSYPKDLDALGVVRDEQGYFSTDIDLSVFDYSVNTDENGKMTYQLGVHMPNGYYYKSPRSGK